MRVELLNSKECRVEEKRIGWDQREELIDGRRRVSPSKITGWIRMTLQFTPK